MSITIVIKIDKFNKEVDWTMTFAEKISAERAKKNISQAEVARAVGVTQTTISYIESGDKIPSVALLKRLAQYFEVSMDYLMNNE